MVPLITPRPLYLRERTTVALQWEAGWAPEPVWPVWRRESLLPPTEFRTPDRLGRSLVAIQTTLFRVTRVRSACSVMWQLRAHKPVGQWRERTTGVRFDRGAGIFLINTAYPKRLLGLQVAPQEYIGRMVKLIIHCCLVSVWTGSNSYAPPLWQA